MKADDAWMHGFIASLDSLRGSGTGQRDNLALSALARGFGSRSADRDMWVWRHLHGAPPQAEETAMLVASAYGRYHRQPRHVARPPTSLGASYAALARISDTETTAAERRLSRLIDSDQSDLPDRIRRAIDHLGARDVGIDWLALLQDIARWSRPGRPVQRRWARDFWRSRERRGSDMTPATGAEHAS